MAKKEKHPETLAIRYLKDHGADFQLMEYRYVDRGGTSVSAKELGVDEHLCIKTIIMETDTKQPFVVLMHGDREISIKNMARHLGVKSVQACTPEIADRHSGYHVGGTSPFGTKKRMKVYIEKTILDLPEIYINAGHRGLLVKIDPKVLLTILDSEPVNVAVE